jgi:hypothetical protein
MEENTFPYRLDDRTRSSLAGLMQVLISSGAQLQSSSMPMTILFTDKEGGVPMDAQLYMSASGISLVYPMNNVAKADPESKAWLNRYNLFISRRLKEPAVPAAERCTVMVEATYGGQLKYYFTYMMRYADNSLAQDMPQGRLYATEPLSMPGLASPRRARPAQPASEQASADWI